MRTITNLGIKSRLSLGLLLAAPTNFNRDRIFRSYSGKGGGQMNCVAWFRWLRLVHLNGTRYCVITLALSAAAQTPTGCTGQQLNKVACLIPALVDQNTVPAGIGTFPAGQPTGNGVLVSPLTSSLPFPSPASGVTYSFDSAAGVYVRSPESFGPLLAERAETIGRNHFDFGLTFQRFAFSEADGQDIKAFTFAQSINGTTAIVNRYDLGLTLDQFIMFANFGLSSRVDVSIALPLSTVRYTGSVQTSLVGPQGQLFASQASQTREATGVGDLNVRLKSTLKRWEHAGFAIAADVRFPTGDAYNALGAGAYGIKPFLIYSFDYKKIAPHVNLGYQWNGSSILTGDIITGSKGHVPNQIPYAAGLDARVHKRVTLDFDILGQEVIHAEGVSRDQAVLLPDGSNIEAVAFIRHSFNMTNGSAGVKVNPGGNFLVFFNLLFRMNSAGLRTNVAPLFGVSYTR
jgi:hypothetical protein